jgi:hypothetical protein
MIALPLVALLWAGLHIGIAWAAMLHLHPVVFGASPIPR